MSITATIRGAQVSLTQKDVGLLEGFAQFSDPVQGLGRLSSREVRKVCEEEMFDSLSVGLQDGLLDLFEDWLSLEWY